MQMNFSMYISKFKTVSAVFLFKRFGDDDHFHYKKNYVSGRDATRRSSIGGDII